MLERGMGEVGKAVAGGDKFRAYLNKFLVESVELRFKRFRGFGATPLIIPEIQSHHLKEWVPLTPARCWETQVT